MHTAAIILRMGFPRKSPPTYRCPACARVFLPGRQGRHAGERNRRSLLVPQHRRKGLAKAQKNLGDLCYQGKGVQQADKREAFAWYKRAAAGNDMGAEFALGGYYEDGRPPVKPGLPASRGLVPQGRGAGQRAGAGCPCSTAEQGCAQAVNWSFLRRAPGAWPSAAAGSDRSAQTPAAAVRRAACDPHPRPLRSRRNAAQT